VNYFDWHEQPGYWADITRHFAREAELLDIGCGSAWLAEHFDRYTGVDGSADAVQIATQRGRNVTVADVDRPLELPDGSFDAIIIKDVLEHVGDPARLIREAHRLLRPGGRVFASSPDAQRWVWDDYTHRRPFTRKSFRLLFSDQGFCVRELGYESVFPGVGLLAARTRRKRRPRLFALLARLPFHRRNVWVLAEREPDGSREPQVSAGQAGQRPPRGL
jgi:SAM-dependent methyltransferase